MIAYCGRPAAASFRDPSADIARTMRRYTIAEICSLGVVLVTALISQTGSYRPGRSAANAVISWTKSATGELAAPTRRRRPVSSSTKIAVEWSMV
jgi:hypothetical protein